MKLLELYRVQDYNYTNCIVATLTTICYNGMVHYFGYPGLARAVVFSIVIYFHF